MSQILFDQVGADTKTILFLNVTKSLKSPGGVPVLPAPVGNVFYVNSVTGSDSNDGKTATSPFATLNKALTKTVNNNGDIVYCMPLHVESVSAAGGLTFPTATAAGVTVVFLGNEVDRAQINYLTSTAATVTIPATNVTLIGGRVLNSIDARVDGFVITGSDCTFKDMEFADAVGASSLISIRTTNAANRMRLFKTRCYFGENTGTARTEFLRIVGGTDHEIADFDNDPVATFSTAVINNVTTATVGLDLSNALITNGTTAPAMVYVPGSTGTISRCIFQSTGVSAVTFPTQGSAFSIDADTVTNAGSHMSTAVQGAPFAFRKSAAVTAFTQAGVSFITCTGGSVIIEGGAVEQDAGTIATSTNVTLTVNNANGALTLYSDAITSLGANKTRSVTAGSTTALIPGTVLEAGKVIKTGSTLADTTGTGNLFVSLYGRILSGAPTLS